MDYKMENNKRYLVNNCSIISWKKIVNIGGRGDYYVHSYNLMMEKLR